MPPSPPSGEVRPNSTFQADRYLSAEVCAQMRDVIAEYGGAEVFFVGRVDAGGLVFEVEPFAFGNQDAVPAVEQVAAPGNVVLHNHPGGRLEPSQADVELAARFGGNGVGSYIVDNAVHRLRVVVAVLKPAERRELDAKALEAMLSPGGPLARTMAGFEHRPEQVRMLRTVAEAFNEDGIGVIEAGTGTGKSLAYLLPAITWACSNGEKVVVSTNTINLQEQLLTKDLPFLQKHLGLKFKAELMKGRNNYLCRRRAGFLQSFPDMFDTDAVRSQLGDILAWAANTRDGSLSDLSFKPEYEVWEQVYCDPDNCLGVKCRDYAGCFFFQARRRAAAADLIVANHHLVMADLAVRRETGNYTSTAVLPAYKRIIFDEAHNLEDVATEYFGIRITRRVLARLLSRLVHRERSHYGLLPYLRDQLAVFSMQSRLSVPMHETVQRIEEELIPLRGEVARSIQSVMDLCLEEVEHQIPGGEGGRELQMRVTDAVEGGEFWRRDLRLAIQESTHRMERLASGLQEVRADLLRLPQAQREDFENALGELKSLAGRLSAHVDEFRNFHSIGEDRCRWIEVRRQRDRSEPVVRLNSLPLEVQEDLNQSVYSRTPTVILTSATLSVDKRFDYFLRQAGLDRAYGGGEVLKRVRTLQLETPFDYEKQAFVGVPVDLPEPKSADFLGEGIRFLLPVLQLSRGGAFLLFTSYRQMGEFHRALSPALTQMGLNCLKQGGESRQFLLQRFKNDRSSVLFAVSSFWEGVDVPGDALRLLVLVKLPFGVPTDPLVQARIERLEALGQDAFQTYSLPQAVIRFKQGFGRLIRTRDDWGAVLILDRRVATKHYGQVFLNSLPSRTVHRRPREEVLEDLGEFFGRCR